jgi:ADP-heptose:LPS heptosyltransferase
MDLRSRVEEGVFGYRSKLGLINRIMAEEMNKAHNQRRNNLLLFLHVEKAAHSQVLIELERILQNGTPNGVDPVLALERERRSDGAITMNDGNVMSRTAGRTFRIVTWGGIGDALLVTPAIRKLKQLYPDCRVHVYCEFKSHKEVLMNNKHIDRLRMLGALTTFFLFLLARLKKVRIQRVNYGDLAPSIFYHRNAAEIIGEMLGIEVDDPRPECFLTEEEEQEARKIVSAYSNPVVIHVTGLSSPNKNWTAENWENLILNNPQYTFLQIGSAQEELVKGAVNLCGTTSIRQAFGIIKTAKAFIGVDSAFAHAAAAFQTPAVILFGASTPLIWGHAGSINLYSPPRCSPCVDTLFDSPCPYGKTCMTNITVSDVERALASLIARALE